MLAFVLHWSCQRLQPVMLAYYICVPHACLSYICQWLCRCCLPRSFWRRRTCWPLCCLDWCRQSPVALLQSRHHHWGWWMVGTVGKDGWVIRVIHIKKKVTIPNNLWTFKCQKEMKMKGKLGKRQKTKTFVWFIEFFWTFCNHREGDYSLTWHSKLTLWDHFHLTHKTTIWNHWKPQNSQTNQCPLRFRWWWLQCTEFKSRTFSL